jgi:hypothetical protein
VILFAPSGPGVGVIKLFSSVIYELS